MIESNNSILAQELRVSLKQVDIDQRIPLRKMCQHELARLRFLAAFNGFSERRMIVFLSVLLKFIGKRAFVNENIGLLRYFFES